MKKKNKSSLLKIGFVSKAHGIQGEIFVRLFNPQAEWPKLIKTLFIEDQSFSVQSFSFHKAGVIFKLKESSLRSTALQLKSKSVFLPKALFKSKKGESIYLSELMSFAVQLAGKGYIGKVQSFHSPGFQDFLVVQMKNKKQILIPFVSSYIKNIDFSKKILELELPENFLEIF